MPFVEGFIELDKLEGPFIVNSSFTINVGLQLLQFIFKVSVVFVLLGRLGHEHHEGCLSCKKDLFLS